MAAAALPVVSCSGITIAQQPLGQIHWKSTTTKLIVHSTIPFNFSVVALFFVGRGTIIIMSIHHHSEAFILIITITTSADSSDQNNIILSYEAAYIQQNIMYTTMNQPMHQIQQSTNNTTIIHPWQNYKFSSTQLWSCCSAGSLSHTSQTAAARMRLAKSDFAKAIKELEIPVDDNDDVLTVRCPKASILYY